MPNQPFQATAKSGPRLNAIALGLADAPYRNPRNLARRPRLRLHRANRWWLREAAEKEGYQVRGFTPSARAASSLAKAALKRKRYRSFCAAAEADPEIAPIIKQIFEWYGTGQCSLTDVTERAHRAGLVSRGLRKPVSKPNIHKLLRKRVYTGDFDWKGKTYRGSHKPLISMALFDRVQEILEGRFSTKQKVTKHEFAFSGLVNCGHCACALVAERKKGKYVYYHCTGNKGKCVEPYAREEVLEACFADLLKGLVFDDQVMDWIV